MEAVFRIGDTFEQNTYLWTIKLTLTTEEDEQWNVLTEYLQEKKEVSRVISRETSIFDDESKEAITPIIEKPRRKRRSRSFDEYRFSKRDFRRSN
jgi:hypothetical protein